MTCLVVPSRHEHVFSVKGTLQLRHFQEVTPEEHAEGVIDFRSPRWGEAAYALT
jgi:hypothetical protein